jgi:uncharacterized protein (DUF2236 family)
MIAGVVRMHDKAAGRTPSGAAFHANDVDLLTWVRATAGFGFCQAYHRYVRPLSATDRDRFYAEGAPASRLYGAHDAPLSAQAVNALFDAMGDRLEPSPIVFEFLDIMNTAPALPAPLQPVQRLLVRAAVEMTPAWVRERLGLTTRHGLSSWQAPLVRKAGALSDRLLLEASPAVQACRRLGLPADYLY